MAFCATGTKILATTDPDGWKIVFVDYEVQIIPCSDATHVTETCMKACPGRATEIDLALCVLPQDLLAELK